MRDWLPPAVAHSVIVVIGFAFAAASFSDASLEIFEIRWKELILLTICSKKHIHNRVVMRKIYSY